LILTSVLSGPACGQTTLQLARLPGVPDQFIGGEILKEAYSRLGIAVVLVDVPAARALALSSSGQLDGEVHRIAAVEHDYPSLIRISPAINYIEPSVFTTTLHFEVSGWPSIKDYNIGIVRGVGSSEAGTAGMKSVQAVTSLENLLLMLDAGHVELAVTDLLSGRVRVKQMRLDSRIYALSPPLQRVFIYHYLHQQHRALVPRIEAVLRDMEADGELVRLRERFVNQVLD